jgi:hypothetical protein
VCGRRPEIVGRRTHAARAAAEHLTSVHRTHNRACRSAAIPAACAVMRGSPSPATSLRNATTTTTTTTSSSGVVGPAPSNRRFRTPRAPGAVVMHVRGSAPAHRTAAPVTAAAAAAQLIVLSEALRHRQRRGAQPKLHDAVTHAVVHRT